MKAIGMLLVLGLAATPPALGQDRAEPGQAPASATVDTAAVLAIVDSLRSEFGRSVAAGDFETMGTMLAEGVVMVGPGGAAWDSLRAASEYPWPPGAAMEITPIETVVLSDEWAYDFGTSVATYTPPGSSDVRTPRDTYLLILRNTPDGWKVWREVASPALPPEVPVSRSMQGSQVEIDHVFVFVSAGGVAEAESLRALGFVVDTAVSRHTGVGTASRSVLFDNAYLELIWMDSEVSRSGEPGVKDMERAADWRVSGASPFGLGLRRLQDEGDYGLPATSYTWEWMRPGSSMDVLKQASETDAFVVFVVPEYMALPSWIDEVRQNAPQVLAHPNGSRRVTGLEIHGPTRHHALAARSLQIPGLLVVEAGEPLLVLELDEGARGATLDLRPMLPLVIRR